MREFFHGWRRKAGCVTIVMACVVFVAGMRSVLVYDAAGFVSGNRQYFFVAMKQVVIWIGMTNENSDVGWASYGPSDAAYIETELDSFRNSPGAGQWIIPYWSLVLPLTLLSAYLISR